MARFRRRSSRGYLGRKRNVDRKLPCGYSDVDANTQQYAYNYTATTACTVKSIKLDIGANVVAGAGEIAIVYALVVVREGYNANNLVWPAIQGDLYNPTMDVLISGVLTEKGAEDNKSNAIGRKLKTGDRLALCVLNGSPTVAARVHFEMPFSVLT